MSIFEDGFLLVFKDSKQHGAKPRVPLRAEASKTNKNTKKMSNSSRISKKIPLRGSMRPARVLSSFRAYTTHHIHACIGLSMDIAVRFAKRFVSWELFSVVAGVVEGEDSKPQ